MADVEGAPPQDAGDPGEGASSGGKKGRYRRDKPWVRARPASRITPVTPAALFSRS